MKKINKISLEISFYSRIETVVFFIEYKINIVGRI